MFFSLWYFYLVDWSVFGENRFEWNDCFFIFLFVGDSSWCVSGERLSCYNELFSAIALQNYFRNLLLAIYGIIVDLCLISDFKCCSFRCEFCPKFLATNQSAVVRTAVLMSFKLFHSTLKALPSLLIILYLPGFSTMKCPILVYLIVR